MRKHWKRIGGVVLLLAIGGALYGWQPWAVRKTPQGQSIGRPTVYVGQGDVVRTLTAFGEVVSKDEITLSFNVDELSELRVKEGDAVKQGQILAVLMNAQEELAMLKAKRALAEAQAEGVPTVIAEKELEYKIAQAAYEATTVLAPFAGLVTYAGRAKGTTGQYQISLLNRSELLIEAMIPELDIHQVALGQEGTATIDALPGRIWPVEIVRISYQAVHQSGFGGGKVVPVTAKFLKVDPEVLPGFSARIQITTAEARGVLKVPIEALIESGPGWAVMVVVEGEPVLRPVEVGLTSDRYAEITSGLEEGEEILLQPTQAGRGASKAPSVPGTEIYRSSGAIFQSP